MTAPLARYLKDFGAAPVAMPVMPSFDDEEQDSPFSFDAMPSEPPVDLEAERAAAHAEGFEQGRADVQALWDEERAATAARHAEEIATLRRSLEEQAAARIETGFRSTVDTLAVCLSDQVAQVLAPVLSEVLAEKAIGDLAQMIRTALAASPAATLTVHGPLSLFDLLQQALGEEAPQLRHVETPDLDLSVDIDEAVLVTRMSAWAASLKKVLG
jgi:flagellar biosynthesis/type III secretory pathway protein FliH